MRSVGNESTGVDAAIGNQPHAVPVELQSALANESVVADCEHSSHNVSAEAPLAETMLNAKIAAKAIPII
jgi:hypothetical protein